MKADHAHSSGRSEPARRLLLALFLPLAANAGPGAMASPAGTTDTPPEATATAAKGSMFRDSEDGSIDMSNWLLDHHGFLPVPIVITDPALGYGGGIFFAFFQRPEGSATTRTKADGSTQMIAPNLFGALVMKTENGSKAYGGGGILHFRDDTWRYKGGVADADFNIDFYTSGPLQPETRVAVNLTGLGSLQQVSRRVGDRELFVSAQWVYTDLDPRLQDGAQRPLFDDRDFQQVNSGVGLSLNTTAATIRLRLHAAISCWRRATPTCPRSAVISPSRPGAPTAMAIGRSDRSWSWAGALTCATPRATCRSTGCPSSTFAESLPRATRDDSTVVLESELRWNVTPRWAGIGFIGAGRAWGTRASFDEAYTAVSKGVGVRYQIARRIGLYVGADYAWGPEDRTIIIQMGSAWR